MLSIRKKTVRYYSRSFFVALSLLEKPSQSEVWLSILWAFFLLLRAQGLGLEPLLA